MIRPPMLEGPTSIQLASAFVPRIGSLGENRVRIPRRIRSGAPCGRFNPATARGETQLRCARRLRARGLDFFDDLPRPDRLGFVMK